jgi:hypothetical protein
MDRVPGKLPNTDSRLIAMAVSLLGDWRKVMEQLRCPETDFREYSEGSRELPGPELDRLISLIIREQGKVIAAHRDMLTRHRANRPK